MFMRKLSALFACSLVAGLVALTSPAGHAQLPRQGAVARYLVLYANDVSPAVARAAVRHIGGTIVRENTTVGLATVTTRNGSFLDDVAGEAALFGAARNRPIGHAPRLQPKRDDVERDRTLGSTGNRPRGASQVDGDPLSGLQWDMEMLHATEDGSYAVEQGNPGVIVAIIDTGIDGSHPDIAPNFDRSLSRNWTTDIPLVDGPCEDEPDQSCNDPQDVDENGHGTHVAGTVAAPLNDLGIAGVAPKVTLVNDRAGQDSGYFFLQETVNALTYAGDIGADVVNMSFFIDPWLFNCTDNPADSPQEQREQATIIEATQRALSYAHAKGVTLVAAEGNEDTDLGKPRSDTISPDFPPGTERRRRVNNHCLVMPTEGRHVIAVSALGPTGRKAYYSNYGLEQTDVSAPGGDRREYFGTPQWNDVGNRILAPYPESVAQELGDLNPDGTPNTPFVVRDCEDGVCAYYQYLQGTSMASPHAVGVAALIVSRYGQPDPIHPGGLTLPPPRVRAILFATATDHPCPDPRRFHYPDPDLPPGFDAFCAGSEEFNGFYGNGIVNAIAAVTADIG
jgi:lantibiotic leader peptide-processing serine protease